LIFISGRHIRAARALLGWEQQALAKKAGVPARTLRHMEGFDGPIEARTETLRKIMMVLEKAGVEFSDDGGPGVKIRAPRK